MKPVGFPQQAVVFARSQPPYLPLPAVRSKEGYVTSCWDVSWREWLRVLWSGHIWLTVCTFNHPLQGTRLDTKFPKDFHG